MWRNHVMVHFVEWLRHHNDKVAQHKKDVEKTVICGLDVYSLHRCRPYQTLNWKNFERIQFFVWMLFFSRSAEKVIEYLEQVSIRMDVRFLTVVLDVVLMGKP